MQGHQGAKQAIILISALLVPTMLIPFSPPCFSEEQPHFRVSSDIEIPALNYHYLACRNWNAGKKREAMKDFKASLKLDPTLFYVWQDRAMANFGLAKYNRAWKDLDQAFAHNPSQGFKAVVQEWQGLILLKRGRNRKALDRLNAAIAYWAKGAQTHYERGVILQSQGEFDRAVVDYDQAIELENKQDQHDIGLRARCLFNKALCLKKLGQLSEANSTLQSAAAYLDLNDRREMFGAPGEAIKLATIIGSMLINTNDER
jgi:tetratricopeptide (TPR) repeat protein